MAGKDDGKEKNRINVLNCHSGKKHIYTLNIRVWLSLYFSNLCII